MSDLDAIRAARIYLTRVARRPAPHLHRLVADLGPVDAAEAVRNGDVSDRIIDELVADHDKIRVQDTDITDPRHGFQVVPPRV